MTVLASMQLVHGGEVGHGVELDSEGVHLQHELVRRLYQLCVRLLAERVRGAPEPEDNGAVGLGEERLVHPRCAGQRAECHRGGHLGLPHFPVDDRVSEAKFAGVTRRTVCTCSLVKERERDNSLKI